MLNLLRDREAFLLFSAHATNRTHTGVIALIKGSFSRESMEFKELKNESRQITNIVVIKIQNPQAVGDEGNTLSSGNPFA